MVKIGFIEDEVIILAAVGVKISQTPFGQGSIWDIYEECLADKEKSKELVNEIMTKHRHLILGDFLPYAIILEDISRLAAIYIWRMVNANNLVFGAGIESSLRVIKPNRYNEAVSDFGKMAFEAYERAVNAGVPEQDARYMLPEGTLTRMIFTAPPRYLGKLANALRNTPLPEFREIGERIETLVKEKFGLDLPQETLFSEWRFWRKVADVEIPMGIFLTGLSHSFSLNMGIRGSLAMYAQLVRQRQILCDIEPLEGIAKKGWFIIPSSFPEVVEQDYRKIASQAKLKQIELIDKHDPNFVYFLLLGQEAESTIYEAGTGVIETSKARSEGTAQWEIRNVVGIPITKELAGYKWLRKDIGPRCWREGKCTEPETFRTKKNVCKAFSKAGGNWKGTLEELLETLEEPYETFEI